MRQHTAIGYTLVMAVLGLDRKALGRSICVRALASRWPWLCCGYCCQGVLTAFRLS
jgi:hypothetical protein